MKTETKPEKFINIVFDGPPSHESGRFVEVENEQGKSIRFGEWIERDDGYWCLRFPDPAAAHDELIAALKRLVDRDFYYLGNAVESHHLTYDDIQFARAALEKARG